MQTCRPRLAQGLRLKRGVALEIKRIYISLPRYLPPPDELSPSFKWLFIVLFASPHRPNSSQIRMHLFYFLNHRLIPEPDAYCRLTWAPLIVHSQPPPDNGLGACVCVGVCVGVCVCVLIRDPCCVLISTFSGPRVPFLGASGRRGTEARV